MYTNNLMSINESEKGIVYTNQIILPKKSSLS